MSENRFRVIGIDPGTRLLGWGVLDRNGSRISHVAHGVIKTREDDPLPQRLLTIDTQLREVLATYAPSAAAVEALFFAKDPQSAAKLGHARGVVLLRLASALIDVHEYPPARVKRAVGGSGQSSKEQVSRMMVSVLGLTAVPPVDASDALANAFTHLTVSPYANLTAQALALATRPKRTRAARGGTRRFPGSGL